VAANAKTYNKTIVGKMVIKEIYTVGHKKRSMSILSVT